MRSLNSVCGAAALLALAVPLAACGSSNHTTTNAASASTSASGIRFADCVRSHGVPNFPDPSSANGGAVQIQSSQRSGSGSSAKVNGVPVNGPAFQAAMQKCRSFLPNGGQPPSGPASPALQQAALKFAACMRSHGVPNFPDPKVYGSAGKVAVKIGGPGSNLDPNSPAFKSAQQACQPEQQKLFGKGPGVRSGP